MRTVPVALCTILLTTQGTGCVPHTYLVERSALVGVPGPDLSTAPPVGHADLSAGVSTVLDAAPPRRGEASEAGLYVGRYEPNGVVRVPVNPFWHVRLMGELAPPVANVAATAGVLGAPTKMGFNVGLGAGFARYLTREFWVGASADTMLGIVPARVRVTCLDCGGPVPGTEGFDGAEPGRGWSDTRWGWVPVLRTQIAAGIDLGEVRFAGVLALRNNPINRAETIVTTVFEPDTSPRMELGPFLLVPGLALSFHPEEWIGVAVSVHQPLDFSGRSVAYGPVVGLSLELAIPSSGGAIPR